MSHDPHDLLAAYALDALDDDERERFERHLAQCEECSEQLALLREPVAALAYAAEGPAPPDALRGRIIESARDEPRAAVIKLRRRNWPLAAVAGIAAAAACLAIGLGIWANSLSNSLDRERAAGQQIASTQRFDAAAINTLLDPSAKQSRVLGLIAHDTRAGMLSVAPGRRAVLLICEPVQAPAGKTFETWVISHGTPKRAGLFEKANGECAIVLLTRRVPAGATVAVTLEPAGGVDKPTTPILYKAEAT